MRITLAALAVSLLAGSAAIAETPPAAPAPPATPAAPASAQALLDASGAAIGASHLAGLRGWREHGALMTAGLRGTADEWVDLAAGAEATDSDLPPISQTTGFAGRGAWTRDRAGVVIVDGSAGGVSAAINQLYRDTDALWTKDRGGATVVARGRETDAGVTYDVLRVTPPKSVVPFDYWFDATTHEPVRAVEANGSVTTTTRFADFVRTEAGLALPHSMTTLDSQGNASSYVLDRVDLQPSDLAARVAQPSTDVHDFTIAGGSQTSVPFDLIDNHVYLDVTIDGHGPYRFVFDTGGANIVDRDVARALGLGGVGSIQGGGVGATSEEFNFATVASLRVGAAELRNQQFLVLPVRAGFGVAGGAPVDGLIGWEVLSRFVTTFDYAKHRLTFALPTARRTLPGTTVGFDFKGTQPEMPCAIAGVPTECSIDTGSRASIDLYGPFVAAHPGAVPSLASAPGMNGFGVGGGSVGRLGRLSSFTFAGYDLPRTIAGFSANASGAFADIGVGGNVGGGVLKRFLVTFDYPNLKMAFEPNANFEAPDGYDRSGIFAIVKNGAVAIADVRPGTPAATAGLQAGEVIERVDGRALALGELRKALLAPAGTVVRMRVLAPGATAARDVTLTLADYV